MIFKLTMNNNTRNIYWHMMKSLNVNVASLSLLRNKNLWSILGYIFTFFPSVLKSRFSGSWSHFTTVVSYDLKLRILIYLPLIEIRKCGEINYRPCFRKYLRKSKHRIEIILILILNCRNLSLKHFSNWTFTMTCINQLNFSFKSTSWTFLTVCF